MDIINKNNFFKALISIQKKLEIHPKHKDVWYELGKIYDELGDKPKAI
jgi:Flp pilus assembly protein TadD